MEANEAPNREKWPAWCSSIAQAAAVMGLPKSVLRAAKAKGCPHFVHSRVNPRGVAEWMESQGKPDIGVDALDVEIGKRDLKEEIETLERMLLLVDRQAEAMARADILAALPLLEQRQALSKQRNDALVQLRRQGRTEDDSVPRSEVERLCRALAYNAALGLQRAAVEIVNKLDGITDPTQQHPIVSSILIAEAYLAPFEQASELEAGHGLPSWVFEAMRSEVDDMVEA